MQHHLDPNILPVFRLIKCSLVQAMQVITSYSFSGMSGSSSSQCWTFIEVAGHLKMKEAILGKCGPILLAVFAPNQKPSIPGLVGFVYTERFLSSFT